MEPKLGLSKDIVKNILVTRPGYGVIYFELKSKLDKEDYE